ncbi:Uncharacterized protein APZ42_014278 [Daphnia magna]|uniref:Uncharacterized protein n=1 Tax=Daphnia magna TaxID=35525 RepID=A0A162Q5P2_9CRUS|nr:Uncharacterized protein APZ42_014278 [Daphnia magna]
MTLLGQSQRRDSLNNMHFNGQSFIRIHLLSCQTRSLCFHQPHFLSLTYMSMPIPATFCWKSF